MGLNITYDKKKLKVVSIDDVRPNTWNPKQKNHDNIKIIEQNIKRIGFNEPIRVRENDGYEIIDGEQRWTAAKNLGLESVVIYDEGVMPDEEARAATIWWQVQIPFDDIKLAYEISALADLDIELPYTDVEIADHKALADFSFDDYSTERPEDDDGVKTLSIKLNEGAYQIIMQAIEKVKSEIDGCTEARALELICADYLGK